MLTERLMRPEEITIDRPQIGSLETEISLQEIKNRVQDIPVCFIIPPSPFLADERVFPFLAGPKIAAVLLENKNPVDLLDLSGYKNYLELVEKYVKNSDVNTFGLTATSPQIPNATAIADKIREIRPDAKIILGGPHVTLTHGAMKQDLKAGRVGRGTHDFNKLIDKFNKLVAGDGENAIFLAIDPNHSEQVIDAGQINSPLFMEKGSLDEYPFPARELIDMDSYHYQIDGFPAFSVIAQLGCPFGCGFCGGREVQSYRTARTRSVDNVVTEIEGVMRASFERENPLTAVMFYDDELNVSKGHLEELCTGLINLQKKFANELTSEEIERLNLKIENVNGEDRLAMRFRGFVKAELFTPEQAHLMYDAGFRVLLSGIESGSDEILDAMRKGTTRKTNSDCVRYAHEAGLKFKALMSIGHPGESYETIADSIEWALSNLKQGDEIDWTVITQYPGSPYYDKSVFVPEKNAWLYQIHNKRTKEIRNLWSQQIDYTKDVLYYKGVAGEYTAYVWTDYLTPAQLVQSRDLAETITRNALNLPDVQHIAALSYEHSMGQGQALPNEVLIRHSQGVIYQNLN